MQAELKLIYIEGENKILIR